MIPVGYLRMGERVVAYNPHLHAIAREGNVGEILPQSEMPVVVTDYYLGCFARGALFALGEEKICEVPNPPSLFDPSLEEKVAKKKKGEAP